MSLEMTIWFVAASAMISINHNDSGLKFVLVINLPFMFVSGIGLGLLLSFNVFFLFQNYIWNIIRNLFYWHWFQYLSVEMILWTCEKMKEQYFLKPKVTPIFSNENQLPLEKKQSTVNI